MTKGKSKTSGRNGSQSNNASKASASDRRHAERRTMEDKSIKLGSDNSGKRKDWQGGDKR